MCSSLEVNHSKSFEMDEMTDTILNMQLYIIIFLKLLSTVLLNST